MKTSSSKVNISELTPGMWPDLLMLDNLVRVVMGYELIVTSGKDGKHTARTSDHYRGGAIDMRAWTTATSGAQLKGEARIKAFEAVKRALGVDWYVKNEGNHFHLSYRPIYRG